MIISDSFLRSYSISRIVKINQEYRNRAKIMVIRKVKKIKAHQLQSQNPKYNFLTKIQEVQDNQDKPALQSISSHRSKITPVTKNKLHQTQNKSILKQKQASMSLLRQVKLNSSQIRLSLQNQKQNSQRMENALNAFKKLKLLDNRNNQKLIQHFCRRNLQNYSIQELKQLSQIERKKQKKAIKQQLQPIRFGRNENISNKNKQKQRMKLIQIKKQKTFGQQNQDRSDKEERNSVSLHQSKSIKPEFQNMEINRNLCEDNSRNINKRRELRMLTNQKMMPDINAMGCKTAYLWEGKKFNSMNNRDIGKLLQIKLNKQKNAIYIGKHRRQQSQQVNQINQIRLFRLDTSQTFD